MTIPVDTISSEIDYTTDTSEKDSINSEMNKLYKRVTKHVVVNNKYDESSESIKKYIDDMNFDSLNIKLSTAFYTKDNISSMKFSDIYNIFVLSTYVIFVDNNKLIKKNNKFCLKFCSKNKVHLIDTEFPGCTFLPFEAKNMIKSNLNKLNNSVFNSELNGTTLYMNNDNLCYGIMFNEGEIIKNCLYKKMEITDTIMFIPIELYNLKQTEYKLRGFCQIVEELGAKEIEIIFKNYDSKITSKEYRASIGNEIEFIAGNLGLKSSNKKEENTNYCYNLTYPNNSTILLNEKMIKNKIKKKKFIVSDTIFKSTLELQYLVHSRCRHLIDKYSTTFSFDNNNIIDKNIYLKLKTHGIEIGGNFKTSNNVKNNINIITNVSFVNLEQCKNLINGMNVSLDEVGFNHIIETIKYDVDNFKIVGIYKIMNFINMYIHHVLKYHNPKHYDEIHKIMNRIKKELTIEEYALLLCNYFNSSSQWIHFTNFIDLLGKKTHSYDKLGYIIIMTSHNINININDIIKFVQQTSINYNMEDKFWKMLQPYNNNLKFDLENKILIDFNFENNSSWYNMNMLINCIKNYTTDFSSDNDEKLKQLITNMDVGYKYWEYYTNILPFITQHTKNLYYINNDELYLSPVFEKSMNIDSFLVSKINTMCELKQFIDKKIKRMKEAIDIKNNMIFPIDICEFGKIFEQNNYINKKIQYIIKTRTAYNIKKLLNCDSIIKETNANDFINKLFTYNEKLDIKTLPKNYIGYELLMDNYNSGIQEEEFKKSVVPFICSHFKRLEEVEYIKQYFTISHFNIFGTSYYEIIQFINKMLDENDL
uniref:Uncharacterized protein n=1 Tax=viral metagenome TaxID=1070528 RepID=A0A6C0HVY1_9ZZZZ